MLENKRYDTTLFCERKTTKNQLGLAEIPSLDQFLNWDVGWKTEINLKLEISISMTDFFSKVKYIHSVF